MDVEVDNIWIIPYTPLLTKMFQTHINVEFCNSVKSINTFVSTATREATWAFSKLPTETTKSLNLKWDYISSNELCWRIFSFHIHDKYPSVVHLVVHLENSQRVYRRKRSTNGRQSTKHNTDSVFWMYKNYPFAKALLYPAEVRVLLQKNFYW